MKNFRKKLLYNSALNNALVQRGYVFDLLQDDNKNGCLFTRNVTGETNAGLYFSIKEPDACSISILIASRSVTCLFHDLKIFLEDLEPPPDRAKTVLAVDLIRLRLDPEPQRLVQCKADYQYNSQYGLSRILEDIDTVGEKFIENILPVHDLADFLSDMDKYECQTLYGGRPLSVDPYIYASLLYFIANDFDAALGVLTKGERVYKVLNPLQWEEIRYRDFRIRSEKVSSYIRKTRDEPQ